MPTLENPKAFDSMIDNLDKEICKEEINTYTKDNHVIIISAKKLYSIGLGYCTEILWEKMKGKYDWKKIDEVIKSMELLKMIKEI